MCNVAQNVFTFELSNLQCQTLQSEWTRVQIKAFAIPWEWRTPAVWIPHWQFQVI